MATDNPYISSECKSCASEKSPREGEVPTSACVHARNLNHAHCRFTLRTAVNLNVRHSNTARGAQRTHPSLPRVSTCAVHGRVCACMCVHAWLLKFAWLPCVHGYLPAHDRQATLAAQTQRCPQCQARLSGNNQQVELSKLCGLCSGPHACHATP